jgi:hypothetical protein
MPLIQVTAGTDGKVMHMKIDNQSLWDVQEFTARRKGDALEVDFVDAKGRRFTFNPAAARATAGSLFEGFVEVKPERAPAGPSDVCQSIAAAFEPEEVELATAPAPGAGSIATAFGCDEATA